MSLVLEHQPRLSDCFSEVMAYVMTFRQTAEKTQPPYEEVRAEILRLLKAGEALAASGFCAAEEYDQARYAVCAWIDESILGSAWHFKGRWRPELLQRLYYQSADAGEKFFSRLKNLEPHQQGIREVYYLCLALGFKGRYCDPDDAYALGGLKERHLKLLFNSVADIPSLPALEKNVLFPESYPARRPALLAKTPGRPWGWVSAMTFSAIACAILLILFRIALYNVGAAILKGVQS